MGFPPPPSNHINRPLNRQQAKWLKRNRRNRKIRKQDSASYPPFRPYQSTIKPPVYAFFSLFFRCFVSLHNAHLHACKQASQSKRLNNDQRKVSSVQPGSHNHHIPPPPYPSNKRASSSPFNCASSSLRSSRICLTDSKESPNPSLICCSISAGSTAGSG